MIDLYTWHTPNGPPPISFSSVQDRPLRYFFLPSKIVLPDIVFFRPKSSENHPFFLFENMKIPVFVDPLKEEDLEIMTMLKSSKSDASSFIDFIFRPNGALVMPLPSYDLLHPGTRSPPIPTSTQTPRSQVWTPDPRLSRMALGR